MSNSVPGTLTVQDSLGSVFATGILEYSAGGGWYHSQGVGLSLIGSEDDVYLDLPAGAAGDLSLAEFPWGVQPTNCVLPYTIDVLA